MKNTKFTVSRVEMDMLKPSGKHLVQFVSEVLTTIWFCVLSEGNGFSRGAPTSSIDLEKILLVFASNARVRPLILMAGPLLKIC